MASSITLLVICVCISVSYASTLNSKDQACMQSCDCEKKYTPVCVNTDSFRKKLKTFYSPCEWMCFAKCVEPKSRFLYCGECDNRPLPKFGSKMHPKDLMCLDSAMKELKKNSGKLLAETRK